MVEIKYEDLRVFSKSFIGILKNLNSKKETPLLKFLINSNISKFSDKFRHLSIGTADVDPSEYNEEVSKLMKESISFTPKGKMLLSEDPNGFIVKSKYRQTGSIGSILRQLVEWDSEIVKTDLVSDSFGNSYVYDKNHKYYFDPKKNEPIFFSDESIFSERKSSEYRKIKFTDSQYEELVNDLKAEVSADISVEEVSGDTIVELYKEKNYSQKYGKEGGTLFSSCMRSDSNSSAIKFYSKCPNIKMIVVKDGSFILGRAMLMKTNVGWFVDRRYYSADFINNIIVQYAIGKKYHYKRNNNFNDNFDVVAYNFMEEKYETKSNFLMYVEIPNEVDGSWKFPYMDTFDKLYPINNVISNYYRYHNKGMTFRIKSTGGNAEMIDSSIRLPISGSSVDTARLTRDIVTDFKMDYITCNDVPTKVDYQGKKIPSNYSSSKYNFNIYSEEEVEEFKKKQLNK